MDVEGKWIIIVGCQRSGTTLTGQIVGANSRCFLIDEPDGVYSIFEARFAGESLSGGKLAEIIGKASKKYTDRRRDLDKSTLQKQYQLVAKAPNLTYDYFALATLSEKPIILYPVRDVMSVVSSILALKGIPMIKNQIGRITNSVELRKEAAKDIRILTSDSTADYIKAAIIWKIKTGLYKKFSAIDLYPLVFKYEDLVSNQLGCVQRIARHCDLDFEENMLNYDEVLLGLGPGNTSRTRRIDSQSVFKWEKQLSSQQINDVLEVGGELMLELGYEFEVGRLT